MSHSITNSDDSTADVPRPKDRELSGRAIVVAMLLLGLSLATLLLVYFEFNTRPFRPLRDAIGREFKRSRPNVEGGRLKGRGATILRITLSVPFDPFHDDAKSVEVLTRVLALARQHLDLNRYEKCEANLIHFVPEQKAVTRSFAWSGADVARDDFVPLTAPHNAAVGEPSQSP